MGDAAIDRSIGRWAIDIAVSIHTAITISYADRSNLATSILSMAEDLHWYAYTTGHHAFFSWSMSWFCLGGLTEYSLILTLYRTLLEQGLILSSFFAGYAVTGVIGGYLSDRFGGSLILQVSKSSQAVCVYLNPLDRPNAPHLTHAPLFQNTGRHPPLVPLHLPHARRRRPGARPRHRRPRPARGRGGGGLPCRALHDWGIGASEVSEYINVTPITHTREATLPLPARLSFFIQPAYTHTCTRLRQPSLFGRGGYHGGFVPGRGDRLCADALDHPALRLAAGVLANVYSL